MVKESDEPILGSADAQLIDPRILMALEDYAASADDAQLRGDELPGESQSKVSVTLNGRPVSTGDIEQHGLLPERPTRKRGSRGR